MRQASLTPIVEDVNGDIFLKPYERNATAIISGPWGSADHHSLCVSAKFETISDRGIITVRFKRRCTLN